MLSRGSAFHGIEVSVNTVALRKTTCEICLKPFRISIGQCVNRGGRVCKKCIPVHTMLTRMQDRFAHVPPLCFGTVEQDD